MGTLRIILAVSVVLGHSGWFLDGVGGKTAVQGFYVISGFYMALILNNAYKDTRLGTFWLNRYLRLMPIYLCTLALIVGASLCLHHFTGKYVFLGLWPEALPSMTATTAFTAALTNLLLLGQDIFMFLGLDPGTGELFFTSRFSLTSHPAYELLLMPQCWTLGMELSFYAIAPFLLGRSIRVLASVAAVSCAAKFLALQSGLGHDPWAYRFFLFELHLFLFGALAYRFYERRQKLFDRGTGGALLAFSGCILLLVLTRFSPDQFRFLGLLGVAATLPFLFHHTRNNRLDRAAGETSYPVYVVHYFLLNALNTAGLGKHLTGPVAVVLALLYATLIIRMVQTPVDRFRHGRIRILKARI